MSAEKDIEMRAFKHLLRTMVALVLMMLGAAEAAGPPNMAGLGGQKCGTWTANGASAASSGIGMLYQQWIFGFLSGVVFTDPDHWPGGVVVEQANRSIDAFCENDPEATIASAAVDFVRKHQP